SITFSILPESLGLLLVDQREAGLSGGNLPLPEGGSQLQPNLLASEASIPDGEGVGRRDAVLRRPLVNLVDGGPFPLRHATLPFLADGLVRRSLTARPGWLPGFGLGSTGVGPATDRRDAQGEPGRARRRPERQGSPGERADDRTGCTPSLGSHRRTRRKYSRRSRRSAQP